MGLVHARECFESWGGSVAIASQLGVGTSITLRLPKAQAPAWFTKNLEISGSQPVVVVDDDPSIHEIWNQRFANVSQQSTFEVVHLYSGDALRRWVANQGERSKKALFLIDYELGTEKEKQVFGLDVLLELSLANRSVLVTSRAIERELRRRCEEQGVLLLPKEMAAFVPISIAHPREHWDALLIGDDPLVRMCWSFGAKKRGIKVRTFPDSGSFFEAMPGIDFNSPVYVDVQLGQGQCSGLDVASELRGFGFEKVYLATGYQPNSIKNIPAGLSGVIGKDPPWEIDGLIVPA